jgi:adenylate cyclase
MQISTKKKRPLIWLTLVYLLVVPLETGWLGLLHNLNLRFSDQLLVLHAEQQTPDPEIVILDIDERSLAQLAPELGRYPWPRSTHAELIEGLADQQPKAIVFDIIFSDPDLIRRQGDQYLKEIAQTHPNVFFAFERLDGGPDQTGLNLDKYGKLLGLEQTPAARPGARVALLLPMDELALTGRIGTVNFNQDRDGIGRRYDVYIDAYGWRLPSLPAKVATHLGIPLPDKQNILLNWRGPALSFQRVSYSDVFFDLGRQNPQRNPNEFRDKIIVIGSTAPAQGDLRATPLGSLTPAVEIVATAIDNLKQGNYLREVGPLTETALAMSLLLLVFIILHTRGTPIGTGLLLLGLTSGLTVAGYKLLDYQIQIHLFTPLAAAWSYYGATVILGYLQERQHREHSIQMFSRFLDARVVHELVDSDTPFPGGEGQIMPVTILFSDIRGFSDRSDEQSAEYIVNMLNDYFSRQVKVIFSHGGTMDKFIGDAIMAFWGAPVPNENQAVDAVRAALEMETTLMAFRSDRGGAESTLDIGIGIHSGDAVVGFIGSENRLDYTAIGDAVNVASRIEGQTKGLARILVSQDTRNRCGDAFEFIDHGKFSLKGHKEPIRLFEPRRNHNE